MIMILMKRRLRILWSRQSLSKPPFHCFSYIPVFLCFALEPQALYLLMASQVNAIWGLEVENVDAHFKVIV